MFPSNADTNSLVGFLNKPPTEKKKIFNKFKHLLEDDDFKIENFINSTTGKNLDALAIWIIQNLIENKAKQKVLALDKLTFSFNNFSNNISALQESESESEEEDIMEDDIIKKTKKI